jgi:cell division protease FtsH
MAELTKGATRVTKVSIIPRGLGALGYTLHLPDDEDRFLKQKHELMAEIDVLLGGRAAEEVFIGEISTGAGNDLDRATAILKDMVSVYGMSDVAGLMVLKRSENSFLGGGMASTDYSEKMAENIDAHIKATLTERYEFVKKTLNQYNQAIENMAAVLLDVEIIEGTKVRSIIDEFEKENSMDSRLAHGDKIAKAEAFAKEQALKKSEEESKEA